MVTGRWLLMVTVFTDTLLPWNKGGKFLPVYPFGSAGYSVVTQCYIIIRAFDVVKIKQFYFSPYISLVTYGYKWLQAGNCCNLF